MSDHLPNLVWKILGAILSLLGSFQTRWTQLMFNGQCLSVENQNSEVELLPCLEGNKKMQWRIKANGKHMNIVPLLPIIHLVNLSLTL